MSLLSWIRHVNIFNQQPFSQVVYTFQFAVIVVFAAMDYPLAPACFATLKIVLNLNNIWFASRKTMIEVYIFSIKVPMSVPWFHQICNELINIILCNSMCIVIVWTPNKQMNKEFETLGSRVFHGKVRNMTNTGFNKTFWHNLLLSFNHHMNYG